MVLNDWQLAKSQRHSYKYVPNLLGKIYVPIWETIAMSLSPNALTIGTLVLSLSHYCLFIYYDYEIRVSAKELQLIVEPIPAWVWLCSGLGIFAEMGLDCLDGIHARRTKSTSLVGELLDHLIDSWRMTLIHPLCLYSLFGRGIYGLSAGRQLSLMLTIELIFLITLITQQVTKSLYYPWIYDLGHYHLMAVFIVTWYKGGAWRWQNANTILGSNAYMVEFYTYGILLLISLPLQITALLRLFRNPEHRNPELNRATKLKPLVFYILLAVSAVCWSRNSPSGVIDRDPRAFLWSVGAIFCDLTLRVILTTITGTDCYGLMGHLVFFIVAMLLSFTVLPLISVIAELWTIRVIAATTTVCHLRYSFEVVRDLCRFFDIHCGFQPHRSIPPQTAGITY